MNPHFFPAGLAVALTCTLVPTVPAEDPLHHDKRHVQLEGQSNFRDLGGYATAAGKRIKWGTIFRSGRLSDLTEADVASLQTTGLKTVVNFLTNAEIEAGGADRMPEGTRELSLPIKVGDDLAQAALDARKTGDFSKLPAEVNGEVHAILVEDARSEYAALFRELADPQNRPAVFHCSHGVHRTGTASAVLLWSLGVPWQTVRQDYLLSNKYRADEIEKRVAALRALAAKHQGIPPNRVDMTNIEAFYRLQGSYIDATRDKILEKYGSIETYMTRGLGLSKAELQQLRESLLE